MPSSSHFSFWLIALLGVPLALCFVGVASDPFSMLRYLPANYLWMAWPHLAISTLALSPNARRSGLLYALGVSNLILVAFWLWVRLAVPPQESGIAWLLYFPVAGAGLVSFAGVAVGLRAWRSGRRVDA